MARPKKNISVKEKVVTKKKSAKAISNKNNTKYIFLIIVSLLLIASLTIGLTYAYFVNRVKINDDNIGASSGKIDIKYVGGNAVSGNIYGTTDYTKGIHNYVKIKLNDNSIKVKASLYLKIKDIGDALVSDALKWAVYKNNEATPVKSGTFAKNDLGEKLSVGDSITIVDEFDVNMFENEDEYDVYTLYIWLYGPDSTNAMQNQTFSGSIYASTSYITGTLE